MKKCYLKILFVVFVMFFYVSSASAHCEIPCGIYDDEMRMLMIDENITTMEKSMQQITALEKETDHNSNQLIRWIMNKEDHADKLQKIVTQYFMTQRIKPTATQYIEKLTVLHKMLIEAMKCKQTTDPAHISSLRELTKEFQVLYFGTGKETIQK